MIASTVSRLRENAFRKGGYERTKIRKKGDKRKEVVRTIDSEGNDIHWKLLRARGIAKMYVCTHVCIYIYIGIYICMYVYIHICLICYVYTHVYVYMYINYYIIYNKWQSPVSFSMLERYRSRCRCCFSCGCDDDYTLPGLKIPTKFFLFHSTFANRPEKKCSLSSLWTWQTVKLWVIGK